MPAKKNNCLSPHIQENIRYNIGGTACDFELSCVSIMRETIYRPAVSLLLVQMRQPVFETTTHRSDFFQDSCALSLITEISVLLKIRFWNKSLFTVFVAAVLVFGKRLHYNGAWRFDFRGKVECTAFRVALYLL